MWSAAKSFVTRFCLALVAALWLGWSQPTRAQDQAWPEPIQISPLGQFAWFPDVAVDLEGAIHVVWASGVVAGRVDYDAVFHAVSRDGATWSVPNDIFVVAQPGPGESAATRPALLVDAASQIHLTFTDYFDIFYSRAYSEAADRSSAWTPVQTVGTGEPAYYSRLASDSRGRLHLIYTENIFSNSCPICYHVFHRRSDDKGLTWSEPKDVSVARTGSVKPQLLIDSDDNLHVVWESGLGGSLGQLLSQSVVQYAASYDSGANWSTPLEFSQALTQTAASESKHPVVGQAGADQLVVVWLSAQPEQEWLYYQVSVDAGRSWSAPERIPGVLGGLQIYPTPLDAYTMATDSAGRLHLVFVGRRAEDQPDLDLIHMTWDGAAWSEPKLVATFPNDVPEWPRLALRNGNELQLVWFTRDKATAFNTDSRNAQYRVWYASRVVDAPTTAPPGLPTRPPAQATRTPEGPAGTPAPTASPTATRPAITPGPPVTVYGETDYLLIGAASALPVLGLIVVVFVVVRLRRRL